MFRVFLSLIILGVSFHSFSLVGSVESQEELDALLTREKLYVTHGDNQSKALAFNIFESVKNEDKSGDAYFFLSLLTFQEKNRSIDKVMNYLSKSKDRDNPLAYGLLYKIYAENLSGVADSMCMSVDIYNEYNVLLKKGVFEFEFEVVFSTIERLLQK